MGTTLSNPSPTGSEMGRSGFQVPPCTFEYVSKLSVPDGSVLLGSRNVGNDGHEQYRARNVLDWQEEHHVERRGQALRGGGGEKKPTNEWDWLRVLPCGEEEVVSGNS